VSKAPFHAFRVRRNVPILYTPAVAEHFYLAPLLRHNSPAQQHQQQQSNLAQIFFWMVSFDYYLIRCRKDNKIVIN
jgi:hypothetical protein